MSIASTPGGLAESTPTSSPGVKFVDLIWSKQPRRELGEFRGFRIKSCCTRAASVTSVVGHESASRVACIKVAETAQRHPISSCSSCTERKVASCPFGQRNHPNLVGTDTSAPRQHGPGPGHPPVESAAAAKGSLKPGQSPGWPSGLLQPLPQQNCERDRDGKLFQMVSDQDA